MHRRTAALVTAVALAWAGPVLAARVQPGKVENGALVPARPPAARYGPDPQLECQRGGVYSILDEDLASAAKEAGKPAPQLDPRLCAAAEALLGWNEKQQPPDTVLRQLSWAVGLPERIQRVAIATIETEEARQISDRVAQPVRGFLARGASAPRYGFVAQRVRKDATKVVLVYLDAAVDLDPMPRAVPAGGKVTVSGKLLGDAVNPQVLACDPGGKLAMPPKQDGKAFEVPLACGDRPGRMQVEIRGEVAGNVTSLAKFPVACGIELPAQVKLPPSPPKGPVDPKQAGRQLLDLMNGERAAIGAPKLEWDEAVAGVATEAAEAMRDQRGASFDLIAALKKADISTPLALQNPVAALTVEDVHALVETSPIDRSNVLNPAATHAGVGVATGTVQDQTVLYVSELLVRELPPADPAEVVKKLRAAIARRRSDARAAPVADDPALDAVAQQYAELLASSRGAPPKEKESAVVAPLYKGYRTVNIMSGVKADPLEMAEEPGVVSAAHRLGVGAALGTSPALGKNSVYVVMITGSPHEPAGAKKAPDSAKKGSGK